MIRFMSVFLWTAMKIGTIFLGLFALLILLIVMAAI